MQILINAGHNLGGRETLSGHIREVVARALAYQAVHLTRVEVHASEENGSKSGPDVMRCTMQARLARHQPLDVSCDAPSLHEAVAGAAEKLALLVGHTLEKQQDERRHRTDPEFGPTVSRQP